MFAVISPSDAKIRLDEEYRWGSDAAPRASILQRSFGAAELVFSRSEGETRATRLFQQGAMKVRFPKSAAGEPPEAVLLNLAGGLTGGDRLEFGIKLDAQAQAVVTTQACERIYRSTGEDAILLGDIRLAEGAKMEWLPQPTIMFNNARLKRETRILLTSDSTLLAVECLIFGRTARNESVVSGALSDNWSVHRDGQLIQAECFAIADDVQAVLDKPAVLNGNRAMASLRYIAPDAKARLEEMRILLDRTSEENGVASAASAWNGMMLVRFVAPDGHRLIREIGRVLTGFRRKPLPRVWLT